MHGFPIGLLKDKAAYKRLVKECIVMVDMCDVLLKSDDDVVDIWACDKQIRQIIQYARSHDKIIITFAADWAGFPDFMDNI